MRTKHGLIDFEDVYVEPNVWRQLGLSRRWLDGAVRQQCAGHLPFERQATANGSFTIRPTGTTDPELPVVSSCIERQVTAQIVIHGNSTCAPLEHVALLPQKHIRHHVERA